MPTPRLVLFALVVLCLRPSLFGDNAPTPTTVSYEDFKRRQQSQPNNRPQLTGVEAIAALHADDWTRRWEAAEALGLQHNRAAFDELLVALANDSDWRLNFAAAIALGRLADARAVPALTATSESHWYPPVRSTARKALAVIAGQDSYPKDDKPPAGRFRFAAPAPEYLDQTYLGQIHAAREGQPFLALRTGSDELNQAALERASHHAAVAITPDGESRCITPVPPRCGLRVDGGVLLGRNRGEWGGDLVFVASPTNVRLLIRDNITGIHRLPCGIVAVAGCAHLGNRVAHLYLVGRSADGTWSARKWRSLPAAPVRSGFLPDGRLYIACANRENVVLSADGHLSMADEPPQR